MGCVMRTARGYLFLNFSRSLSLKGWRITCNGGMRLKAALYLLNLYTIFNKYTSKTVFILGKKYNRYLTVPCILQVLGYLDLRNSM